MLSVPSVLHAPGSYSMSSCCVQGGRNVVPDVDANRSIGLYLGLV